MNNVFSLVKHEDVVRIDQSLLLSGREPARSGPGSSPPHQDVCYFPWTYEDHKRLSWYEMEWTPARLRKWQAVVSRWKGVAAICGQSMKPNTVRLVRTLPSKPLQNLFAITVKWRKTDQIRAVTWSIDKEKLNPLLILSGELTLIYVYDVESRNCISTLRGHGGRVTSLSTHPRRPSILCTTSRDKSCRFWDLDLDQHLTFIRPQWPGGKETDLGPPFGCPSRDKDATGKGRCFGILTGGSGSYGHHATPSFSHFHPKQELIVTCGVDHAANIWAVPPSPHGKAQAPLVNDAWPMSNLQKLPYARLLCAYWLSDKIILCQSTRSVEKEPGLVHAGELIVWEWLAYDRLYNDPNNPPPSWETGRALAECKDTRSFKILSIIPLPASSNRLSFDGTLVLLTTSTRLMLIDPTLLPERGPRKLWWLPDWEEEDNKATRTFGLSQAQASIQNGERLQNTMDVNELKVLGVVEVIEEFIEPVRAAAMLGGRIILGVGENTTHVWRRDTLRAEEVMETN